MAKLELIPGGKAPLFECYFCHATAFERLSLCPECGQFDTYSRQEEELTPSGGEVVPRVARQASKLVYKRPRFYSSGSVAWDQVLGGGFVRPSSTLIYGPRGVGKSTRALQVALHVAELAKGKVLYGSAEMPAEHIRLYAERLGLSPAALDRLWIQDSSDALDLLANIDQERPAVVVWDSIQRFTWEGELGDVELRNVVHHALEAGKAYKLISILLSQVGKEEQFLGPNGIGHDVDVMVRLSRKDLDLVVEVPDKNRFAPTPASANERFWTEVEERKTVDESRLIETIDECEATRDWMAQGSPARPVRDDPR